MRHRTELVVISGGNRGRQFDRLMVDPDGFWPEISNHWQQNDPIPPGRENSPGRVILEVLLVLGVAGTAAMAAAIWMPTLS